MLEAIQQSEMDELLTAFLQEPIPFSKPTLTRLYWESEDVYVSVIRVNGISIAKRQDNGMVNGTKLLNLAVYNSKNSK